MTNDLSARLHKIAVDVARLEVAVSELDRKQLEFLLRDVEHQLTDALLINARLDDGRFRNGSCQAAETAQAEQKGPDARRRGVTTAC